MEMWEGNLIQMASEWCLFWSLQGKHMSNCWTSRVSLPESGLQGDDFARPRYTCFASLDLSLVRLGEVHFRYCGTLYNFPSKGKETKIWTFVGDLATLQGAVRVFLQLAQSEQEKRWDLLRSSFHSSQGPDLANRLIPLSSFSLWSVQKSVAGVDRETLADIPKCEARHYQRWGGARSNHKKVGTGRLLWKYHAKSKTQNMHTCPNSLCFALYPAPQNNQRKSKGEWILPGAKKSFKRLVMMFWRKCCLSIAPPT